MLFLALLLFLLPQTRCSYILSEDIGCTCQIGDQSITDFGAISIVGPQDSEGNGCKKTCTIQASSGDSAKGLTNLWLTFSSTPNAGSVVITNNDGSTFVKSSQNIDSSSPEYNKITTSENITITIIGDTGVWIMGQMMAANTLGTTTATLSSTAIPTFPPCPGLKENPKTMAHDIMFAIDVCGTKNLKDVGKIASDIVENLSVSVQNSTEAPIYKSRLALTRLTPFGNFAPLAPPWTLTSDDLSKFVLHLNGFPGKCKFTSTLQSAIKHSFAINGAYPSRPNAQRTLLLLTSGLPAEGEKDFQTLTEDLLKYDVHLVVVGYNLTDDSTKFYNNKDWFSFYSTNTVVTNEIFNNYLLDGNKLCPSKSDENAQCNDLSDGSVSCSVNGTSVAFPYNYKGPDDKGPSDWKENGQIGRYCNFQNIAYSFPEQSNNINFTIYYDLEVERDFLRVYDGKKEIISLTGKDVSGTKFTASNNATIVFSSDSREVFGGYYIKVN